MDHTFPYTTDAQLITDLCKSQQDTMRLRYVDAGRGQIYQFASQRVHELMHYRPHQPEF